MEWKKFLLSFLHTMKRYYFFNTLNHLIDNFDNLDFKKFEIVVVDNASTDRTQEIALKAGARVVVETKRSIAKARNTGAKFASGQNFIFVDADTLVPMKVIRKYWI